MINGPDSWCYPIRQIKSMRPSFHMVGTLVKGAGSSAILNNAPPLPQYATVCNRLTILTCFCSVFIADVLYACKFCRTFGGLCCRSCELSVFITAELNIIFPGFLFFKVLSAFLKSYIFIKNGLFKGRDFALPRSFLYPPPFLARQLWIGSAVACLRARPQHVVVCGFPFISTLWQSPISSMMISFSPNGCECFSLVHPHAPEPLPQE